MTYSLIKRVKNTTSWICVIAAIAFAVAFIFALWAVPAPHVSAWLIVSGSMTAVAVAALVLLSIRNAGHTNRSEDVRQRAEQRSAECQDALHALVRRIEEESGVRPQGSSEDVSDTPGQLLERGTAGLEQIVAHSFSNSEALEATVVALSRKVQTSAHRIQEEAGRMVQRHPGDHDVLDTSMRVDHAAAQQARNAQTLAVLCGERPGQQWQQELPLTEVVRGAAGRITSYQRIEISGNPPITVISRMVEPLIHLVAELLANATQSSPPSMKVLVALRQVQRGAVIEIDDCGIGMDDTQMEQAREIASGRRKVVLGELGQIPQTGLPVVGEYARRYHFRVDLAESAYGGIRAIVLVPSDFTEPLVPSGSAAIGRQTLTRNPVAVSVDEPPRDLELRTASAAEGSRSAGSTTSVEPHTAPATEDAPELTDGTPELPRRRSRRGEAPSKAVPPNRQHDQHGTTWQTAEQAGEWMGSFLGQAAPAPRPSTPEDGSAPTAQHDTTEE